MTGADLRKIRRRLGFTRQAQMARAMGVSLNTYGRYERARRLKPIVALAARAVEKGLRADWR